MAIFEAEADKTAEKAPDMHVVSELLRNFAIGL
jgi:hypothetical protein